MDKHDKNMGEFEEFKNDELIVGLGDFLKDASKDFSGRFEVIPENYNRFTRAYLYFSKMASECDGHIENMNIDRASAKGGFSAVMGRMRIGLGETELFSEIVKSVDIFIVDPLADGKYISVDVTVNDVWRRIK